MKYVNYLLAVGLLTGCGSTGAIGQSQTAAGADDRDGVSAPLAVGATTTPDIALELRGSGAPTMSLESIDPSVLAIDGGMITGVKPGISALMIKTKDDLVLDWLHIFVAQPDRLDLHLMNAEGEDRGLVVQTIELATGESVRLRPEPYLAAQRLVGRGPSTWTVEPPIASALREGVHGHRRLLAQRPGKATVTVASLGLSSQFELVVLDPTVATSEPGEAPRPEFAPEPRLVPEPEPAPQKRKAAEVAK